MSSVQSPLMQFFSSQQQFCHLPLRLAHSLLLLVCLLDFQNTAAADAVPGWFHLDSHCPHPHP